MVSPVWPELRCRGGSENGAGPEGKGLEGWLGSLNFTLEAIRQHLKGESVKEMARILGRFIKRRVKDKLPRG
jgi:hypothetical protein